MGPGPLQALLSLLSDPDEEIVRRVRTKLFEMGESTVREVIAAAKPDSPARREADRVLHLFREPALEDQFRNLSKDHTGDIDLEEGAFTLAKLAYPDVEVNRYQARLDQMANDLAPQIAPDDHPIRVIRTLNHYLFEDQKFRGHNHGVDPDISYLNRVLDNKRGLPIAISAIYILLARRLDLPIVGIGMPLQFIVKYKPIDGPEFLIDPFNRGQVLTRNECADILADLEEEFHEDMLPELPDRQILVRMMVNLVGTYEYLGKTEKSQALKGFIRALKPGIV
jgi:regulator of sirC expression with transglutaminase-like and TPR domain